MGNWRICTATRRRQSRRRGGAVWEGDRDRTQDLQLTPLENARSLTSSNLLLRAPCVCLQIQSPFDLRARKSLEINEGNFLLRSTVCVNANGHFVAADVSLCKNTKCLLSPLFYCSHAGGLSNHLKGADAIFQRQSQKPLRRQPRTTTRARSLIE